VARAKGKGDDDELVINAREPGLGVGKLLRQDAERRTYEFVNGGERSFKEAYCKLYIKPALHVPPEVKAKLYPPPAPPPVVKAQHVNDELEAQICQKPDEAGPYLVYADWLLQRQDPRGNLITVQSQRADAPRNKALADAEKKLLDTHRTYFVPAPLDEALRLPKRGKGARCEVTWSNGYFAHVRLARDVTPSAQEIDLDIVAQSVLGHPSAKFLRSLTVGPLGTPSYSYISIIKAIQKERHPLLGEIHIGDFGPADVELASSNAGDVSGLFKVAPAMSKLTVKAGALRFGAAVDHAKLRELYVTTTQLAGDHVKGLFRGKLPALETLSLVTERMALDPDQLTAFMKGSVFPALRHLTLRGTANTKGVIDALLDSELLARLESLDLSGGDLRDPSVNQLLARRDRFQHLAKLDLGNNKLSPDEAARVAKGLKATAERARFAITESDVVRKSPDKASMAAARKLARADKWLVLGHDTRRDRVWGEYEGTDHYYVSSALRGREFGCGCGSPKNPCKHVLALLLIAAHQYDFPEAPLPEAAARNASPWRPQYSPVWE